MLRSILFPKRVFAEEKEEEEQAAEESTPEAADEDEIVDIRPKLLESCKQSQCKEQIKLYNDCVTRLEKITATNSEKTCASWYFDIRTCADACVAPRIFATLK